MKDKILQVTIILVICALFSGIAAASTSAGSTSGASTNTAEKPSIASINPASGKVGEITNFTLSGKNFQDGMKVFLTKDSGSAKDMIYADSVKILSGTQLTGTFAITPKAPTGKWNLGLELDGMKGTSKIQFDVIS